MLTGSLSGDVMELEILGAAQIQSKAELGGRSYGRLQYHPRLVFLQ
jgi:hypothetical protein